MLEDAAFRDLLVRRSRLRWSLTSILVGAYLVYGLAGLYLPNLMAAPFLSSAVPWSIAIGFAIILLAILLSLYYVRRVNRIIAPLQERAGRTNQ